MARAELKIGSLQEVTWPVRRYALVMFGPKYTNMWHAAVRVSCDHTNVACAWCRPFGMHAGCEHLHYTLVPEKKLRLGGLGLHPEEEKEAETV